MSIETMTKLASTVLSGSASSVTFSNIPQGYTDLKLEFSIRTDKSAVNENVFLSFNGSTSNFSAVWMFGGGGAGVGSSTTARIAGFGTGASATASVFGASTLYVAGYSDNVYKTYSSEASLATAGTTAYQGNIAGLWSNPSPVTSITLTPETGPNFVQNSSFTLYGIKDATKTAGNSIKATGGNIVFDGTYVYHVFNATGTFVASQPLTATVVSVGGGGGGGWNNAGGGGGGEVDISSNISVAAGSSNVVVVGSGGATATSTASSGANGTTSSFASSVTSLGGGGGGTGDASASLRVGQTGGSGGGGSLDNIGGSASGSNTNAGGQGFAVGSGPERYAGGGGGGATAAGGNADTNARISGTGGQGYAVANIFSGFNLGAITHLGSGGSGGIYVNGNTGLAGTAGTNAGTGGQQSTSGNVNPTSPTPNAGGGGGGGSYTGVNSRQGSNGGSGIVIVRYKG